MIGTAVQNFEQFIAQAIEIIQGDNSGIIDAKAVDIQAAGH